MNTSTQLKALIRNIAKEKGIEAEIILRRFMLERLLERISVSPYNDHFILIGGMLIASMVGMDTRATMDMDTTITGQTISAHELEIILCSILSQPIDDGVTMKLGSIDEIHDVAEYPGYRASIAAIFDKTRQNLKIDITTGDLVTPKEIDYAYKLLFEQRSISVKAYNMETILAEKYETIITRGLTNTRMRDFYDIYILSGLHEKSIDYKTLGKAVQVTASKRGTMSQLMGNTHQVIERIENSSDMRDLWERYQKKNEYAANANWMDVIQAVKMIDQRIKGSLEG